MTRSKPRMCREPAACARPHRASAMARGRVRASPIDARTAVSGTASRSAPEALAAPSARASKSGTRHARPPSRPGRAPSRRPPRGAEQRRAAAATGHREPIAPRGRRSAGTTQASAGPKRGFRVRRGRAPGTVRAPSFRGRRVGGRTATASGRAHTCGRPMKGVPPGCSALATSPRAAPRRDRSPSAGARRHGWSCGGDATRPRRG